MNWMSVENKVDPMLKQWSLLLDVLCHFREKVKWTIVKKCFNVDKCYLKNAFWLLIIFNIKYILRMFNNYPLQIAYFLS